MTALSVAAPRASREFAFDGENHRAIAELAYREVGILLPPGKAQLIYSRIAPRVRACKLKSVSEYIRLIERDEAECFRAIDALTTNHTFFFRESHHFDDFRTLMWPQLKERLNKGGRVRLWSAACSSGEEPYSWLMSIVGTDRSASRLLLQKNFRMLATDVSPSVLSVAKEAAYPAAAVASVPAGIARTWMKEQSGSFLIDLALREPVTFIELNLLNDWPIKGRFDAIFCRNVMIYFDGPTKARLQARLADRLEVGGLLCIGHSERLDGDVAQKFEIVGRTSYRKIAA